MLVFHEFYILLSCISTITSTGLNWLGSKSNRFLAIDHWVWREEEVSGHPLSPEWSTGSGTTQCMLEANGEPWLIWLLD